MAVKHTHPDTGIRVVHSGIKGGTTGCGVDTSEHPAHWTTTLDRITCGKNGCKS